ncbi:MAG: hypothetical protein BYD32DRAFT_438506 [Podila humilis]|nr:MAG: hypothetical protein BYD32DRAFT_438506 [Podila humilis]
MHHSILPLQNSTICLWCDGDGTSERFWDATLLEAAIRRFPTVLKRFTLDITDITGQRLLRIQCPTKWPTIKSLVLSGHNTDSWINLWTKHDGFLHAIPVSEPHLLFLAIVGSISLSPLLELWLNNVQMEDGKDWDLIVEAIDFATLRTAHTHNTSAEFTAKLNLQAKRVNVKPSPLRAPQFKDGG